MSKITIVMLPEYVSAFIMKHLRPVFSQWFDFVPYDANKTYNRDCVFVTHHDKDQILAEQLWQQGFKVAVEELWEYPRLHPRYYTINCAKWFWFNEAFWYMSLGYERYYPTRNFKKLALMPIGRRRPFRDQLVEQLGPMLDLFVWSYHDRMLPNDLPLEQREPGDRIAWQRHFNPEWYDSTSFSLVVETQVTGADFVTEKTWKPIAYMHPFMVLGPSGTLKNLRAWGFETYDNLFDESYDTVDFDKGKLDIIINNVKNFQPSTYDDETRDRVAFNKNRFFSTHIIRAQIKKDIVDPLQEFING
jgi:hypothetical protein